MQLGRITIVGTGGLLGEIMATELARHGPVATLPHLDALIARSDRPPEVIAVWADASELGRVRFHLRRAFPPDADPLLVFLSQVDPHVYFTRLRAVHVDRRRMGFNEVLDAIAGQLVAGMTTIAPAQTRLA